jgi:hypothetical protein
MLFLKPNLNGIAAGCNSQLVFGGSKKVNGAISVIGGFQDAVRAAGEVYFFVLNVYVRLTEKTEKGAEGAPAGTFWGTS